MIDLVRAQALLSSNTPKSKIAEIFGVSPAYISQLIEQGKLYDIVENSRDAKWDKFEDLLLDRAEGIIETTTNPKALLALLRLANSAVRRGNSQQDIGAQQQITNTIVNINLPERARARLQFDDKKRLVAINDTPMLTVSKKDLPALLESAKEHKNVQVQPTAPDLEDLASAY